ncbi:uncharacterized protein LOC120345993 [Styela clava]
MASEFESSVEPTQSQRLMSSLERLRKSKFLCDFAVKVGDKSFLVHRTVLAASSEYFERMFASNMREVSDGFVIMKNVDQDAIAHCIDFMYTGDINFTSENIEPILHVSCMLQMIGLRNRCFKYLQSHLSPRNCISVINLGKMYHQKALIQQAENIISEDFDSFVSSKMFPSVEKSDLLRYIQFSHVTCQTSWRAVITWAKANKETRVEDIIELIKSINISGFPFKFILETVLNDSFVKRNLEIKKSVICSLFSDVKNVKRNLNIDNCFVLEQLAENQDLSNGFVIQNVIRIFMAQNFELIIKKEEFLDIHKDDIVFLYESPHTIYSMETSKWFAALKWVKKDLKSRKRNFSEIFALIKLGNISSEFLKHEVRSESLVTKSEKCNNLLMNELFSRLTSGQNIQTQTKDSNTNVHVDSTRKRKTHKISNQQPPNGTMSQKALWHIMPGYTALGCFELTFSFPHGCSQDLLYHADSFCAYLPDDPEGWELCNLLRQTFKAELLFNIENIDGQTGQIVWNKDIPVKTSIYGGPARNGYPDPGYLGRLRSSLKAKLSFFKPRTTPEENSAVLVPVYSSLINESEFMSEESDYDADTEY